MNQYNAVRYQAPEEIPVITWAAQRTVYEDINQAKFAAAKLWASCGNYGVRVKKVIGGWAILFWR